MMKKLFALIAASVLVAAVANPAVAGKAKKVTLYLHGPYEVGEANLPDSWLNDLYMTMDTTKPSGAAPKSMFTVNYVEGPNQECSGNGLLPVWKSDTKGTVTGTVTLTLHTLASPGAKIKADLYPDGNGGCNSGTTGAAEYTEPAATTTAEVAPGHAETKFVFKNVNFKSQAWLLLQLQIAQDSPNPSQVRVFYDSPDMASNLQLTVK